MKKSAPSRSILSLFLFFGVGLSVVFAVVNSEIFPNGTSGTQSQGAGWASPAISSKEITIWNGTCRKITSTTGTQYYIPTYSQAHWDRFVANKPSGITIGYCPPTATITASPLSVVYGNGTNLTWSSTNTDYCERTGVNPVTYGTWPSGAIATGSTIYTNPLINSPTTFYLRCHGLDGTYATANVTVSINPIIGECNNAVMLGCKSGQIAFNDNGQESCNTTRTWQCRGQFGGSNSPQCSKANTTCVSCSSPWGGAAIAHGSSITAYASSSVACGNTCSSQTRTCNDGSLNGSYTNSSCSVATCASCSSPWGGAAIAHGSSITAYASSSVACGNTCSSQTRTCNDGSLGGSFTRSSCNVDSCTTSGPYTLGSWGSCTGPCGTNNGTQSRTVSCGYTTCTGQSNTSQNCTASTCSSNTSGPYTLGSWGSCTGPCGTNNGTQSRTVSCGYTTCTGQSNTTQNCTASTCSSTTFSTTCLYGYTLFESLPSSANNQNSYTGGPVCYKNPNGWYSGGYISALCNSTNAVGRCNGY